MAQDFAFKLAGRLNPRQMARIMAESDIFIDLSDWQGMGMTAIEGMVAGAAVIVTRYGGPPVYAAHEQNCLMVDTRSREECIAALDRLVSDADLRPAD